MELISEIKINNDKAIQLLKGDLSDIPEIHAVDILVISAFPNDYTPTPSSLIGSLHRKGLSIWRLAKDKEIDLRSYSHCWLSKEIDYPNVSRILCFEPPLNSDPYSSIAGIFESLSFLSRSQNISAIAIPLIMTGDQEQSAQLVIEELIKTAQLWLNNSTIKKIKIVIKDRIKLEEIHSVFQSHITHHYEKDQTNYDFFISYSRRNFEEAELIKNKLKSKFRVFFDTEAIKVGSNWLNKINTALPRSDKFIVCLSPDYVNSKMCKYEYSYCNLKFIEGASDKILPIFLHSTELPFEMSIINHFNAREGDISKIEVFCKKLIEQYT